MTIAVLRKNVFEDNAKAALENRRLLGSHNVVAFNIMGGAGCGKTTLLEQVIPRLQETLAVAVLEGDLATTKDAERIAALHVPVVQLLTEGGCHLTAGLVEQGLRRLPLDDIDVLLIENVGNPICPANFDLGEHYRVAVLSVAEGDDKPAKYPYLFKVADLVVVTKMDLVGATNFQWERAAAAIRALDAAKIIVATGLHDASSATAVAEWMKAKCAHERTARAS